MAGSSSEQSGGQSKLDVNLNLVPFIDLLSTLVLFLLLTAVWIQVAAIPTGVDSRGKSTVSQVDQTKLVVQLAAQDYRLKWPSSLAGRGFPASVKKLEQLEPILKKLIAGGVVLPAAVGGTDEVPYGDVIKALDFLKSAGLQNIAVNTD